MDAVNTRIVVTEIVDLTRCLMGTYEPDALLVTGTQCVNPGDIKYMSVCVHEHIDDGMLCLEHSAILRDAIIVCGTCESVDGHRCVMRVTYG